MKKITVFLALFMLICMTVSAVGENVYPLQTEKPVTLSVWMPMDAGNSQLFTNYADSPVYQRFQEKTGINIKFMHPTYGAEAESFSILIGGSELPDIIVDFGKYKGGLTAAYDDGLIYDLTPYLEQYAPAYYALINQSDDIRRQFYNDEGKVLAFSMVAAEPNPVAQSVILRKDWCEEFGLVPEELDTYDEIEVYFQKVLENKPGITPLVIGKSALIWSTMYWGYNLVADFYQIDGQVMHYAATDANRRFLERLHSWYQKGYLTVDFATMTEAQSRKLFSAEKAGCIIVAIGNAYSDAQTSGLSIAKGPYWRETSDMVIHNYDLGVNVNDGANTVITKAVDEKLLPIICQFLDYAYTEEGSVFSSWGPEGLSWNYDENNNRIFTDWVLANEKYPTSIMHNVCRLNYWPHFKWAATTCNPNVLKDETVLALRKLYTYMDGWDGEYIIPSGVTMTLDETNRFSSIMTNVDTYVNEMKMQFIKGDKNINTDWDTFVKELNRVKIEDATQIMQTAYDRYLTR